jgi:hypothetical protein
MSASITLARGTGYADRLRAYRVMLDCREIGRIGNGETKLFPVAPGQHELAVKIDWCSSNDVSFSLPSDQSLAFLCDSTLRGLKLFAVLYYALFARKKYLWLRRADM